MMLSQCLYASLSPFSASAQRPCLLPRVCCPLPLAFCLNAFGISWLWVGSGLQHWGTPAATVLGVSLLDCSFLRNVPGSSPIFPNRPWSYALNVLNVHWHWLRHALDVWQLLLWIEGAGCHLLHKKSIRSRSGTAVRQYGSGDTTYGRYGHTLYFWQLLLWIDGWCHLLPVDVETPP